MGPFQPLPPLQQQLQPPQLQLPPLQPLPQIVSLLEVQEPLNPARRCLPMATTGSSTEAASTRRPQASSQVVATNSISFGTVSPLAPRLGPRHSSGSAEVSTLFWCATETDVDGYVSEWGKCAAGCKADPAGSYLPAA